MTTTTTSKSRRRSIEDVPQDFLCPITLQVMNLPLISRHGHNFERSAILKWLGHSSLCPLTRKPLRPSDLFPNCHLEQRIRFWRLNNDVKEESKEEEGDDSLNKVVGFILINEEDKHKSFLTEQDRLSAVYRILQATNSDRPQGTRTQYIFL
jgi:hypothetical protein